MDQKQLEARLAELPLYAYGFVRPDELAFSPRVRSICRTDCPMYNRSWSCPPAVGDLEACRARVRAFSEGLVVVTAEQVEDDSNLSQTLATRPRHEALTRQVIALVRTQAEDVFALSGEACSQCARCAWPEGPCRHPDLMRPCLESHGILVTDLAEKLGIPFMAGDGIVTWYSLILFR